MDQKIEQFPQPGRGLLAYLDQTGMPVDIFEQKPFELLLVRSEGIGHFESTTALLHLSRVPSPKWSEDPLRLFEQIAYLQFDEGMNEELSSTLGLSLIQGNHLTSSFDEG
jgi:hypothetical protein